MVATINLQIAYNAIYFIGYNDMWHFDSLIVLLKRGKNLPER